MKMGIGLGVGINRSNYAQGIFNAYSARVVADGGVVESGSCVDAVSSLLQSASLLLIPSGYKGGKLYSEIPTNGNGDLTWARTSTANRTNASGNIELMATGVPRLSYMYGSCPSALLEPQRTNTIRNSTMVGAVSGSPGTLPTYYSLTNGGLTQSIVGVGVENGLNYIDVRFQGTATGTNAQIVFDTNTSNNATSNQTYIFSLYSKLISGSANSYTIIWDEWTSTPTYLTSKVTSVSLTSTTTRFSLSGTTASTCATIQPFLRFGLTIGVAYDFTFRVLQPQLELGAYFTTPIFTSGTFATRIADSFSRSNIYTNGLISASGGTWFVELRNNVSYTGGITQAQLLGLGNDAVGSNANNFWLACSDGTTVRIWKQVAGTITALYTTTTSTTKIAIKWNGTSADVFVNGTKQISATSFTQTALESLRTVAVQHPYFIQQMALFPTPLSDTDCTTLTTL